MMLCVAVGVVAAACSEGTGSAALSLSVEKLSFSAVWPNEHTTPTDQLVTVSFAGSELTVSSSPDMPQPGWLLITRDAGGTAGSAAFRVTASAYGRTAGVYSSVVRFATGSGNDIDFKDLPVELAINDTLTIAPTGDTVIGGTVHSYQFANTLSVEIVNSDASWEATLDSPWLQVSPSSGHGRQTLTITALPAELTAGIHPATLTVASADRRLSASQQLTLAVDGARWTPSKAAVGFTATRNLTSLSETIEIGANVALDTLALVAHSDAAWLTATLAGSTLTLTADPAGLSDGLRLGSVTLSSALAVDQPPTTVRVSLYKLDATIGARDQITTLADDGMLAAMAIDPLRPRMYVGATIPARIEGYDLYTRARVLSTVPPLANQRIWKVSRDGRYLLTRESTLNRATGFDEWGPTVIPFDLDSETWLAPDTVHRRVDDPHYTLDGVELSRFNEFADSAGERYQEIDAFQPSAFYGIRYFANPVGSKWFIEAEQTDGSDNRLAALDVRVYQLARKIVFRNLQQGTLPARTGNTRDFTNQGRRVWFGYGWVDYDADRGFGDVHLLPQALTMPGNNSATPQEYSMNERGESIVLWFGILPDRGSVGYSAAHYDASGALTRADDYPGSGEYLGGIRSSPRTPDGLRWVTPIGRASPGFLRQITNQ